MTTYGVLRVFFAVGTVDLQSDLGASGLVLRTLKSESELSETVDLETR